jgi:hypothetical protein
MCLVYRSTVYRLSAHQFRMEYGLWSRLIIYGQLVQINVVQK